MTTSHTPGPWYWDDQYKASEDRKTWSLIGSDGYGILSCDGEENSPQGLNDEANARLISAAPELLEALQKSIQCLSPYSDEYVEASAAIAKATGAA